MRRPYAPEHYAEVIRHLHAALPDATIGADVLTGFPGETTAQFENTFRLLENLPVSYFHVFPFSPRPGTPAETMPGRLQGDELKRRAAALHELGRQKRERFHSRFVGKVLEAICETEIAPGLWEGTSPNYIAVTFPCASGTPGQSVRVRITGVSGGRVEGREER